MDITFFGAAQNVTGSKHVIETNDLRILLDCGMHQGRRQEAYALNKQFPFDPKTIDAVILSHAHADHCGLLPMLVKQGYDKKIYATPATIDISRLIMLDSAHLQLDDFSRLQRFYQGKPEAPMPPLYSAEDVEIACEHFEAMDDSHEWHSLHENVRFKFYNAGHILGSVVTVIESIEDGKTKRLVFTGDLGNTNVPLLPEPEIIEEPAQAIISECTYGDRIHKSVEEADQFLIDLINEAVAHKKRIIIPAFALGRTQEIIYILHKLYNEKKIPAIPIAIDSPLGNSITDVFKKYREEFDTQTSIDFPQDSESPFAFKNMRQVVTVDDSRALEKAQGPIIIIASSGMCEGGRVLHHLEDSISDPNAVIVLAGFQAEHTLGRKIQDGISPVRIYNRMHDVKARIVMLHEFSAHADQVGLTKYISSIKDLKEVFLVHAELNQAEVFEKVLQAHLPNLKIFVPKPGESFSI